VRGPLPIDRDSSFVIRPSQQTRTGHQHHAWIIGNFQRNRSADGGAKRFQQDGSAWSAVLFGDVGQFAGNDGAQLLVVIENGR
jgi:hypothetical protein